MGGAVQIFKGTFQGLLLDYSSHADRCPTLIPTALLCWEHSTLSTVAINMDSDGLTLCRSWLQDTAWETLLRFEVVGLLVTFNELLDKLKLP